MESLGCLGPTSLFLFFLYLPALWLTCYLYVGRKTKWIYNSSTGNPPPPFLIPCPRDFLHKPVLP